MVASQTKGVVHFGRRSAPAPRCTFPPPFTCGEGKAINQIAAGLGLPQKQVYAVELSEQRAAATRELMPEAKLVGPASFLGMKISVGSFGLAYCNPPFDNELGGGGREEASFVEHARRTMPPGGVLVLVCPLGALNGNKRFCVDLDAWFENIEVYKFPDPVRKFNEIVLFGTKRRTPLSDDGVHQNGTLHRMGMQYMTYPNWFDLLGPVNLQEHRLVQNGKAVLKREPSRTYTIPSCWKPSQFHKGQYLPEELDRALERSPLNYLLMDLKASESARPPLPPGKGHVALLLASGMLNGVVEAEDGNHVVRGTAKKVEYHNVDASEYKEHPDTGALISKDVYSEKVVLTIRAVWQDGSILTMSDSPEGDEAKEADPTVDEGNDREFARMLNELGRDGVQVSVEF